MNNSTQLNFNNEHNLKFFHNEQGVIVSYKKKKFILGFLSLSDLNSFSDEDYLNLAKTTLRFHTKVRNVPLHKVSLFNHITPNLNNDYTPFYKYINHDIYDKYIKNGIFQLGTIQQYRNIENEQQRDEFEGHSCINLTINNQIISLLCNSGFNYYIFCGTKSINSEYHKKQFGDKIIKINDVKLFAETICKQINAVKYYIQNIEYNTLKLYINKNNLIDTKIDTNNILNSNFFDLLQSYILYPSIFVKPEPFKTENEVRIIFEMKKDVSKPYIFENKTLLKLIECN